VDGRAIDEISDLRNALAQVEVGRLLDLTVLRDGRRRTIRIPVEEAQPDA
jgi:S1-C subfamily serine protease